MPLPDRLNSSLSSGPLWRLYCIQILSHSSNF